MNDREISLEQTVTFTLTGTLWRWPLAGCIETERANINSACGIGCTKTSSSIAKREMLQKLDNFATKTKNTFDTINLINTTKHTQISKIAS